MGSTTVHVFLSWRWQVDSLPAILTFRQVRCLCFHWKLLPWVFCELIFDTIWWNAGDREETLFLASLLGHWFEEEDSIVVLLLLMSRVTGSSYNLICWGYNCNKSSSSPLKCLTEPLAPLVLISVSQSTRHIADRHCKYPPWFVKILKCYRSGWKIMRLRFQCSYVVWFSMLLTADFVESRLCSCPQIMSAWTSFSMRQKLSYWPPRLSREKPLTFAT